MYWPKIKKINLIYVIIIKVTSSTVYNTSQFSEETCIKNKENKVNNFLRYTNRRYQII